MSSVDHPREAKTSRVSRYSVTGRSFRAWSDSSTSLPRNCSCSEVRYSSRIVGQAVVSRTPSRTMRPRWLTRRSKPTSSPAQTPSPQDPPRSPRGLAASSASRPSGAHGVDTEVAAFVRPRSHDFVQHLLDPRKVALNHVFAHVERVASSGRRPGYAPEMTAFRALMLARVLRNAVRPRSVSR